MTGISIEATDHAGVMVVTLVGRLELTTHAALRDGLLKCAADSPLALVVRLGVEFEVAGRSMLAVFTTVWMKIQQWPDIPMVLAAETDVHRHELRRSGVARFVATVDDLPTAVTAAELPPPRRFRRVPLPNTPTAPMMARAVVREVCAQWDLARLTGDAVLVVSELVENAVRHARSESVLRVELRQDGLSIAVRDHDPTPAVLTTYPPTLGFRGVEIVDRVSRAWGCTPSSDGGKIVWAVLARRTGE